MHHTFALRVLGILLIVLPGWGAADTASAQEEAPKRFRELPADWTVTKSVPAFSRKIADREVRITNTHLAAGKRSLQVNAVVCKTDEDAAKVHEALVRIQGDVRARCPREGKLVFELVGEMPMVERAYLELGFRPQRVTYDVSFQATPIAKCDYMVWNKLFNAFLAAEPSEEGIRGSKEFTFGDQVRFRNHGAGSEPSSFSVEPKARATKPEANGEITSYNFANLTLKHGVPQVGVTGVVTSEAFATTPSKRRAGDELLGTTDFWPSADEEIVALARKITAGSTTANDKVAALLVWFSNIDNFRYDGKITGSRHGVKTALRQRFGHCWDYSDCFVTLCRASGVPCRQVLGWLYGMSGHVWAEVLIDGKGWRQVDPQVGAGCDSRYVPFVASESGAMPMVYTSAVRVVPRTESGATHRP